jgi:hypothetical protein
MAKRIVELADAVKTSIQTLTSRTVRRRYVPYFDSEQVVDGKWFILVAEEDPNSKGDIDTPKLTIDLGYQKAIPEPTDAVPEPEDHLPTLDAMMEEVETIKNLFAEGGAMRERVQANCVFLNYRPAPLYRQDFLYEMGIFFSVIRLEYLAES